MAKRVKGGLSGSVTGRVQVKNPVTMRWVKVNTKTGRIVGHKKSSGPYKNVRRK